MNYLLIGKPNAGKSSIFNILTSFNSKIVHSEPGTTRDWHKELIKNTSSYIFDTPGILINEKNNKKIINFSFDKILEQNNNIFLYVIDYKDGFNETDNYSINQLRKFNYKIILIINKCDNLNFQRYYGFERYGIEEIIYISCAHKHGINELKLLFNIKKTKDNKINNDADFSISVFGKPNVGKSTFLNSILGYQRVQTSNIPGTTSDYVIEYIKYKKKRIKIIDTAGINKKSNVIPNSINYHSIIKTFENINKVDSCLIIIDSQEGLDRQDKRIIKLVSHRAKSIILIFNKFDLIKNKIEFKKNIIADIYNSLSETKNIKIFFISSFKSSNVSKILEYLLKNIFINDFQISTARLNQWLKKIVKSNPHPLIKNKVVNFKYVVQIKSKPITIKIFSNYSSKLKENYKRFIINNFNYNFKILNQKTKIIFSSSKNPYI